ncbi:hypothetical protein AMJ86_07555 [bacterium SM23_57]|jgi:uncharacterized membrane protein (DUF4010 family)|nr:MAG: hypothetical protein AMJ86_07555 [bacterium SM23_57]
MSQLDLFIRFGASIAIGFMIGLQREFAKGRQEQILPAGERTFALLGLVGCLASLISDELNSPIPFFVIIFIMGIYIVVSYYVSAAEGRIGLTSEVAAMIAVLIGALCYWGYLALAVAIGIVTTLLLSLKVETDRFVRALTREDIKAALELAVISAIVLPVLPNRSIFEIPFDVFNPFMIWLMVVFISGISFLGYVAIKVVGPERGIGLTGFLGGLVSSTAVTLSFSERSKIDKDLAKPLALSITIAWTVMFPRILFEVGVLNLQLLKIVWIPIVAAGLAGLIYCGYLFFSHRASEKGDLEFSNPFDLGAAIKFGLLYGVVLLVSRVSQYYFGDKGLFLSSIIAGFADVDAITLSVAELTKTGGVTLETGSQAIVIAAMSNTLVKGGIAIMGGSRSLRKAILPGILLILVVGVSVVFLI